MPNLAPITTVSAPAIADVLKPIKTAQDNTVALFAAGSNKPVDARMRLTSRYQSDSTHRAIMKLEVPVIAIVDGVNTVIDTDIVEVNYRCSVHTDAATADVTLTYAQELLNSDLVKKAFVDGEAFW